MLVKYNIIYYTGIRYTYYIYNVYIFICIIHIYIIRNGLQWDIYIYQLVKYIYKYFVMSIHEQQPFWCERKGARVLTHSHILGFMED